MEFFRLRSRLKCLAGGPGALGDTDPNVIDTVQIAMYEGANTGTFYTWDLTSLLQQWADGKPNYGLLVWDSTLVGQADSWSSEYDNAGKIGDSSAHPPTLSLEYSTGPNCDFDGPVTGTAATQDV